MASTLTSGGRSQSVEKGAGSAWRVDFERGCGRRLGALLAPQAVELNLPARSRSSVLRELVVVAERTGLVYDAEGIREALEQREALGSTGLAGGIAFPHPRRPMPYATAEPLICLARVPAGIPFGAPDGRVTDLFVLVVSHEERQHLCTLARLSLLFQDGSLAREVREAESVDEALTALVRHEQALVTRSQ